MTPPRIFISHSAQEAASNAVLQALFDGLTAEGFDVFLDRERVLLGSRWRDDIQFWLDGCHGALLLLSQSAIEDSVWVRYEASVLGQRRVSSPSFPLLPVYLPPMSPAVVTTGPFEPMQLHEVQGPTSDDPNDILRKALDFFTPLKSMCEPTPLHLLEEVIARELRPFAVNPRHLEQARKQLGLPPEMWNPRIDPSLRLAQALFKVDAVKLGKVARLFQAFLEQPTIERILKIVTPFLWVDPGAARCLAEVVERKPYGRSACINASSITFTGDMYSMRACRSYPPGWAPVAVDGVTSGLLEELIVSICRNTAPRLGLQPDATQEEINQELAALQETYQQDGIFVVSLPPPLIREEMLHALQAEFPHISFLVFSGAKLPEDSWAQGSIERLLPMLQPGEESQAEKAYETTLTMLLKNKGNPP
jgi:hypothetical protein